MSEENNVTWSISEGPNLRDSLAINFFTNEISKGSLRANEEYDFAILATKAIIAANALIKALEMKDEV